MAGADPTEGDGASGRERRVEPTEGRPGSHAAQAGRGNLPRVLPWWAGPFWTWYIVAACVVRGSDLALGPRYSESDLGAWVNVIGNHVYGLAFLTCAALVSTAKLWARVAPLVLALALTSSVHVAYAIALFQGVLSAEPGFVRGWRFAGGAFLLAIFCAARVLTLLPALRSTRR